MEVVDFLSGKGKVAGSGTLDEAVQNKVWYSVGVLYVVNDKMQVLLGLKNRKSGGDGLWSPVYCVMPSKSNKEVELSNLFKDKFGLQISPNRLQHLILEKSKVKVDKITHKQFVDMYLVKKNVDINDVKTNFDKVKFVQLKTYISYLKNKNENYKIFSKNGYKILQTYLNFKQFMKNK